MLGLLSIFPVMICCNWLAGRDQSGGLLPPRAVLGGEVGVGPSLIAERWGPDSSQISEGTPGLGEVFLPSKCHLMLSEKPSLGLHWEALCTQGSGEEEWLHGD